MLNSPVLTKSGKITAIIAALIGIFLFLVSFYEYAVHDYKDFITSYAYHYGWPGPNIWSVYLPSAIRFTFRLSYVTSFVGLLFLRRWSVYLCLIAWLGQLLPSIIFSYLGGYGIDAGHIESLVCLLIYIGIIVFCWPVLKPGRAFLFCGGALVGALLIHTAVFAPLFNSAAASGGHIEQSSGEAAKQEIFWKAINESNVNTVKSLLAEKAFHPALRGKNCDSNTICNLISYAVAKGNVEIVRMLHEAGSPIDEQDGGSGDTPIIRALLSGHVEVAEYLAEAGADPFRPNRFGIPAFIVASGEGSPRLVEMMIKAGAPVDFKQIMPDMIDHIQGKVTGGVTPLMIAASSGRLDLIETLLKNGADASLKDEAGHDVFAYARAGINPTIETPLTGLVKAQGK